MGWKDIRDKIFGTLGWSEFEWQFALLGCLAKSDGWVSPAHIQQAREEMHALHLDDDDIKLAMRAFNRGKSGDVQLLPILRRWQRKGWDRRGLLMSCWRMAAAEGQVSLRKERLILLWGRVMGIPEMTVLSWGLDWDVTSQSAPSASYSPPPRVDPYYDALRLLGVPIDSEPSEIKQAYRRLLSVNHPDKLTGAGASDEAVRMATERTRELHKAYELIRERRGF